MRLPTRTASTPVHGSLTPEAEMRSTEAPRLLEAAESWTAGPCVCRATWSSRRRTGGGPQKAGRVLRAKRRRFSFDFSGRGLAALRRHCGRTADGRGCGRAPAKSAEHGPGAYERGRDQSVQEGESLVYDLTCASGEGSVARGVRPPCLEQEDVSPRLRRYYVSGAPHHVMPRPGCTASSGR